MTHEAYWIIDDVITNAILLPNTCNYSGDCPSTVKSGILQFTSELLEEFETYLKQEITEIIASPQPFIQTEDEDKCEYCAYAYL